MRWNVRSLVRFVQRSRPKIGMGEQMNIATPKLKRERQQQRAPSSNINGIKSERKKRNAKERMNESKKKNQANKIKINKYNQKLNWFHGVRLARSFSLSLSLTLSRSLSPPLFRRVFCALWLWFVVCSFRIISTFSHWTFLHCCVYCVAIGKKERAANVMWVWVNEWVSGKNEREKLSRRVKEFYAKILTPMFFLSARKR